MSFEGRLVASLSGDTDPPGGRLLAVRAAWASVVYPGVAPDALARAAAALDALTASLDAGRPTSGTPSTTAWTAS